MEKKPIYILRFAAYCLLAILSVGQLSCKKYLDEKSDSSLVVPSTLGDLQALMDGFTIMNYGTPGYGEASGDDYFLMPDTYNSFNVRAQNVYTWSDTMENSSQSDWAGGYNAVYNSNLTLYIIKNIPRANQK